MNYPYEEMDRTELVPKAEGKILRGLGLPYVHVHRVELYYRFSGLVGAVLVSCGAYAVYRPKFAEPWVITDNESVATSVRKRMSTESDRCIVFDASPLGWRKVATK